MEKNSGTLQRKKHDTSIKDGSEMSQSSIKTRQKRGSTSQTPVSSSVNYSEESNQCNGLSTLANQTPKSRSTSVLSSSEPLASGRQRRSARLSQMESQQLLQTSEKKKKKSDEQKTPGKDKRKGRVGQIMEEEKSEKPVSSKRTPGKSKKSVSGTSKKNDKGSDEEIEEPVEKKAKRGARRSVLKEPIVQEDSNLEDKPANDDDIGRNNVVTTPKSSKKRASKKQNLCEPSSPTNEHESTEINSGTPVSSKQDNEKQEPAPKSSKRKKSMSSTVGSNEECVKQDEEETATSSKISKAEERIQGDVDTTICENELYKKIPKASENAIVTAASEQITSKAGSGLRGSAVAPYVEAHDSKMKSESSEIQQPIRGEKLIKEPFSPKVSTISPSKADLVQEYNRSISEKISLLKPKAFIGRSSASFRKTIDDRCDGSGQEVDSDAESRRAIMESAQRRIEQNLSTSESDSRLIRGMHTPVAHSSKNDSSESDSAPEAVSFSNARQDAMDTIKSAAEHVKREKQRLKERRKARLEMLKQQKEEKLIRLKEKMASQEDASCSSSEESGYEEEARNARQKLKKKKAKSKAQRTEKENLDDALGQATSKPLSGAASDSTEEDGIATKEAASLSSLKRVQMDMFQSAKEVAKTQKVGSSSNKMLQEDKLKKKKSKSGRIDEPEKKDKGFKNLTSLDYIPLSTEGATKFMVVPLDKAMRAPKSLAEEAADLRQKLLYGSRIKREPSKVVTAYQQKLVASGKNFHVR